MAFFKPWKDQTTELHLPNPRNNLGIQLIIYLVVSTHPKNITQNGNLPRIGVKIKNIWNHHLVMEVPHRFWISRFWCFGVVCCFVGPMYFCSSKGWCSSRNPGEWTLLVHGRIDFQGIFAKKTVSLHGGGGSLHLKWSVGVGTPPNLVDVENANTIKHLMFRQFFGGW